MPKHKKRKNKDFVVDFLKRVSSIKSEIFEDKIKIHPKEQTGVLLYINGGVIAIVVGTVNFLLLLQSPTIDKVKLLPLIWIILGFASIFASDYYLNKRNIDSIKILFTITLLHFLTATSYFFSGILCFIGTYFIFESKYLNK